MNLDNWLSIRSLIIGMVLSTDMSKHFNLISQFRARAIGLKDLEINSFDDKVFILSFALKCADLGHSAKNIELHKKWSFLVCEELFEQGDIEKSKKISVSMYCDRDITDIDKSQAGFLKNICMPLYDVWNLYLNSEQVDINCVKQLTSNQMYWESRGKFRRASMQEFTVVDSAIA